MSEADQLVLAFMDTKTTKEELNSVNRLVIYAASKDGGFVDILTSLAPWFADDKPEAEIVKALKLIGEVLAKVRNLELTLKQKEVLTDFFLKRLRKLAFVDPSSKCIELLFINHLMTESDSALLGFKKLTQLLEGDYWLTNAYVQAIRQRIYNCILAVLKNRISLIAGMEAQFVRLVLEHTNEERDPRNLFVVLAIWQKVLYGLNKERLIPFKDDIFDALNVYFPIIFKNKSTTSTVTVDDLNTALNRCLSHELLVDQFVALVFSKMADEEEDVRIGAISGLVFILESEFNGQSVYFSHLVQSIIDRCKTVFPDLKEKGELKRVYALLINLLGRQKHKTGRLLLLKSSQFSKRC